MKVVTLRCEQLSCCLMQSVSRSGIGYCLSHVTCLRQFKNSIFQMRQEFQNHLHLYLTDYYNFVCTVILLLLTIYVVNVNISPNMTFTPIVIFGLTWTYFYYQEKKLLP